MMMLRSQSSLEQGPRVVGWAKRLKTHLMEVLFSFTFNQTGSQP